MHTLNASAKRTRKPRSKDATTIRQAQMVCFNGRTELFWVNQGRRSSYYTSMEQAWEQIDGISDVRAKTITDPSEISIGEPSSPLVALVQGGSDGFKPTKMQLQPVIWHKPSGSQLEASPGPSGTSLHGPPAKMKRSSHPFVTRAPSPTRKCVSQRSPIHLDDSDDSWELPPPLDLNTNSPLSTSPTVGGANSPSCDPSTDP